MKTNGHHKSDDGTSASAAVLEHPDEGHPRDAGRRPASRRSDQPNHLQALLDEATANARAIAALVRALEHAATADEAIHAALNTIREAFGWEFGSYRPLREEEQVLQTSLESGSMAEEVRSATFGAKFREGDGLCGGAWKARDLIFIPDFGAMTGPGYLRAPIFKKHGIRSAMCFPIIDRRQGDRHDGLLHDGDARPVGGAQGGIAKRRPPGLERHPRLADGRQVEHGRGRRSGRHRGDPEDRAACTRTDEAALRGGSGHRPRCVRLGLRLVLETRPQERTC